MTDPITIIGTAGAIANIVDLLGKTISKLNNLQNQWKIADLTVTAFKSQLAVLKQALSRIQAWADGMSTENHYELLMCVESSVTCCRFLVARIDEEVAQLQTTAEGQLNLASKVKLLFKTKDMVEVQRMIDQQTQALNLLLSVCNSNALEQKRLVEQPQVVSLFRQMQKDTASLIVHRDADSAVTASSISSSQLEVRFDFDRELFVTKVYEKWIRHRLRRDGQKRIQAQAGMQPVREASRDGGPDEQNLNGAQDECSRQLSRQTSMSSRHSSSHSLFKTPLESLSFEMKPLKRSLEALPSRTIRNFRSEKDLQKKHSRIIDRQLDKDSKRVRREAKILVLGAESRQDVLQMMRMTHLGFSEAEFEACRPVVAGYLVSCAKAWSQAVQTSSALQFGATQKHCEVINSYIAESGPGGQLSPEFTTAITSMLELEPVTAMFESGTVVLPDHSAYFLENASRISSPDYMPSEMDVVRAREMTRGVSEVKLTTGSLTISLIDVGSQSTETIGKKWISCFENVTAVMFVVDLDCYDQMQLKESSQNGLVKSLLQFESVVNSRWFMRSSIILILNQWDRFKDKLRRSPLANYFSDYSGGDDVNKAAKYILWRFNQVNRARHSIYPHLTQSTDTSTLRVVFAAVKHMILIDFLEKTSWLS